MKDDFKIRRKVLETLVKQEMLFCLKHNLNVTLNRFYKSHCYIGRRSENKCPYLQFKDCKEYDFFWRMQKEIRENVLEKRLGALLEVYKRDYFYKMLMNYDFVAINYDHNKYYIEPIEVQFPEHMDILIRQANQKI